MSWIILYWMSNLEEDSILTQTMASCRSSVFEFGDHHTLKYRSSLVREAI